jgi:16S rRNA (guanine527-N7)-methyltransferase
MSNRQFLMEASEKIGITLDQIQTDKFLKYKEFLISYNEKVNLTSILESKDIILKHFIDSLSISEYVHGDVIDVGTGAGFPTVPIKIINPNINLTLLDSLNKRIIFLEQLVSMLQLNNVNCIHSRAEDAARLVDYREKFDVATSRAVANLSVLAELCLPFVKIGGKFISMKGPDVNLEIIEAESALFKLGAKLNKVIHVNIPFSDIVHTIVIIDKLHYTPSLYPRKLTKISKNPIR